MLHFEELRITPDNKYLIIDVSVDKDKYFNNIAIDSIIIDTQDTYSISGPSSNPVYTFNVEQVYDLTYSLPEQCSCNPIKEAEEGSYCFTTKQGVRSVRLILSSKDLLNKDMQPLDLGKNMFFVYAIATGTPDPSTPCGLDNSQILGTAVNLYPFYQASMKYLSELENECQIPKNFIDMILKFKGLQLSVKMKNYTQAIKYWNKFFSKINYQPSYTCKCNGQYN